MKCSLILSDSGHFSNIFTNNLSLITSYIQIKVDIQTKKTFVIYCYDAANIQTNIYYNTIKRVCVVV